MTQKELEQLRPLRGEIRMHDEALKSLEREHEAAHWPEKVQEVREIIEGMRQRCAAQLEGLEHWLAAVPDDFMREVLTLRYSDGLMWKNVAARVAGSYTAGTIRVAAYRYLERESA